MNQEGTLGHAIKSARKNYPLTLEELGEKVGVSHAFLSRVENNKITPNDKLLVKIANVLDFNETQDFLNEFRILAGYYDNIDENTAIFNNLKSSGRLEINRFKNEKKIVDKPYYKLNYLLESENKVFYDIKTSELGEKLVTIELPPGILHEIYKMINLEIIKTIKNNSKLLKSIENPQVIMEYQKEMEKTRKEFTEYLEKSLSTYDIDSVMSELYDDEYLI
ncbi:MULTISPECIES: helix-turn-helix domain-containing protein [Bacillati]|uniref:helix-turn-helix domain-containing protein n=1 Tax=Bacillati TaxID=1783272 RepID=UPI0008F459E8|nr:helix-turn-helix transcriptional regulator [Staphylococcus epidermidis]MBC3076226.1 helix-turn-helix transcriptional regulator [Staphylococcus epidermidis]MBC8789438.1 helix-turn-helix transcriptional regulator [Staphylococcus epidermidis]MBE7320496.1 helix-turn-helix transcriptional regulator [Staphylococcus epidermidis]MBM0783919.1 XRE family transcriptional regulator [Staphylococcus epidermidis]MBM0813412.1 XRE family transcriptional regulator [Staphylococcus epidermidis]